MYLVYKHGAAQASYKIASLFAALDWAVANAGEGWVIEENGFIVARDPQR